MQAVIISGCAANRNSLVDNGVVSIKKQDNENIESLWTDVYQQDGRTWVYGVLRQRGNHSYAVKAHLDIQVINLDGSVMYETTSKDIYVPPNRVGKGIDWKRFEVRLPGQLPDDSRINIAVHSGSHKLTDS